MTITRRALLRASRLAPLAALAAAPRRARAAEKIIRIGEQPARRGEQVLLAVALDQVHGQ